MNTDIAEGKWKQMKGEVQEQWGKLTNDKFDEIAGQRKNFVGHIQEAYGISKEDAEKSFEEIKKKLEKA